VSSELFVYWHARGDQAEAAICAAQDLQATLRGRFPALAARLYRRPEERDGRITVMEVYSTTGDFAPALRQAIDAAAHEALDPWLQGERHVEVFDRL